VTAPALLLGTAVVVVQWQAFFLLLLVLLELGRRQALAT
jgi:hypothetical protein